MGKRDVYRCPWCQEDITNATDHQCATATAKPSRSQVADDADDADEQAGADDVGDGDDADEEQEQEDDEEQDDEQPARAATPAPVSRAKREQRDNAGVTAPGLNTVTCFICQREFVSDVMATAHLRNAHQIDVEEIRSRQQPPDPAPTPAPAAPKRQQPKPAQPAPPAPTPQAAPTQRSNGRVAEPAPVAVAERPAAGFALAPDQQDRFLAILDEMAEVVDAMRDLFGAHR